MKNALGLIAILGLSGCAGLQTKPEPGDFSITAPDISYILIVKPDGRIYWPKGEKVGLSYILADYQRLAKAVAVGNSTGTVKGKGVKPATK